MSQLNQLELFRSTISHTPHAEFLYKAGFTPHLREKLERKFRLKEGELAAHFGLFSPVGIGSNKARKDPVEERPDVAHYYRDLDLPEGAYIDHKGVLHLPGSLYHFTKRVSPLRNAERFEELERFPYAEAPDDDLSTLQAKVEAAHRENRVAQCGVGHMYEDAWQIRGYEEFLMDMVSDPEWSEYILDRITERNVRMAEKAARAGVDLLTSGDDVANQNTLMFAPDVWRKFIKSRWAKVYESARRIKPDIQIWYHSDGNITEIIPELIEIGVTILNPVQPECMDIEELHAKYGRDLVFDGTVGTQTTMPFGTPEEVRELVRERKRTIGRDGGLILSPTHVLEPEVPVENVTAFFEACRERE